MRRRILQLAEADGFHGHLAPERDGFGKVVHRELGLRKILETAVQTVVQCNPILEQSRIEPSRLPMRLLCERIEEGETEILRLDNGTWAEVQSPPFRASALVPEVQAGEELEAADLTLLASPIAQPLFDLLKHRLESRFEDLRTMPWNGIALGALRAGRLIEKGLPHYLDRLESISLAVLTGNDAEFVSLIPRDRNVPANREFVSEAMTGFEWGIDKKRIEFYVLKGDREVRSWIAEKGDGPKKNVPVTLQLRQMPGQSWARLSVSSSEWGPLARDPIRLDWDALEPDDRSPEQILKKLKRPRPIIPNRVDEQPHIGLWNGELVQPGLASVLDHGADQVYRALSRSWRDNRWVEQRQTYRPVGTDGTLPEELSLSDKKRFDDILELLEKKIWRLVNRNDFAIGNKELLCLTWSFTRCPESIKNLIIDSLSSYNSNQRHILHSIPSARTVLQQGAGRAIDGPERVARLLHILSELSSPNTHTRAAMSFLLSRRKEAPEALNEKLVQKIAKQLYIRLIKLHENSNFKQDFKYILMTLTGLLRYREISPFSLISNENNIAGTICNILVQIEKSIRRHVNSIAQGRDKLAIVGELLKMLAGTGGDPDLLRRIDDLND